MQRRPKAAGEFMVTVQQGQLILGGLGAVQAYQTGEIPTELGTLTISPYILSRLLTNPRSAKLLAKGMNLKTGGYQSGAVLAKIMADIYDLDPFKGEE